MIEPLQITALCEADFASFRSEWQELLARSDADPLFMSWDWQWLWWKHHRDLLNGDLRLLSVRSESGRLIALAPMYEHRVRIRGLPVRRLEPIGQAFDDERVFFSEYLDFIVDRQVVERVLPRLFGCVGQLSWDEFVVAAALPGSHVVRARDAHLASIASIRAATDLISYQVPLVDGFEAYARALPHSVRRRLLNHRQRLVNPSLHRANSVEVDALLDQMVQLKRSRWGERFADSPSIRAFEHELAHQLSAHGQLELTALSSAGDVLAVMYNARVGRTEYYLQSAFRAEPRGISLGYLHFGYVMEAAARQGVAQFDLLAGAGLATDYKRTLTSQAVRLISFRAVRAKWLRALYRVRERLPW